MRYREIRKKRRKENERRSEGQRSGKRERQTWKDRREKKSKLVREREKEEELSSFTSTHRLQEVRAASNRAPSGDKPHPQG